MPDEMPPPPRVNANAAARRRLEAAARQYWGFEGNLRLPGRNTEIDLGDGSDPVRIGLHFAMMKLPKAGGPDAFDAKRNIGPDMQQILRDVGLGDYLRIGPNGRVRLDHETPTEPDTGVGFGLSSEGSRQISIPVDITARRPKSYYLPPRTSAPAAATAGQAATPYGPVAMGYGPMSTAAMGVQYERTAAGYVRTGPRDDTPIPPPTIRTTDQGSRYMLMPAEGPPRTEQDLPPTPAWLLHGQAQNHPNPGTSATRPAQAGRSGNPGPPQSPGPGRGRGSGG